MLWSSNKNEAIVQKFIAEHKIPDDVARDCPELTEVANRLIGDAVAQLRAGATTPEKADALLRVQLVEWAIGRAAANDRANAMGDVVLV